MFPLIDPRPNVLGLLSRLKGENDDFFTLEFAIDDTLLKTFCIDYLHREWVPYDKASKMARASYWDNVIECYYRLGFSGLRVSNGLMFEINALSEDNPRKWSNHTGQISDEESYHAYPWPTIEDMDLFDYEYVSTHLYEGMGIFACVYGGILEMLSEYLLGFENLSYMLYDDEGLLKTITNRVGDLLLSAYKKILKIPKVVAILQGDDMGYNSGLMFPIDFLRTYIFPWHKALYRMAKEANIPYLLHSCGNLRPILDELITFCDAKHSFENNGLSVIDFCKTHGKKVGVIGGIDMDILARGSKTQVKEAVDQTLEACFCSSRYVLGSGNSIPDYVPMENFIHMLESGYRWFEAHKKEGNPTCKPK